MTENVVLAGEYEGASVRLSSNGKCAYIFSSCICPGGRTEETTKYINKLNVEKVTEVSRLENKGILTRGTAMTSISESQIMLEIHWKDGKTSLVNVDNKVHKAMIVGMYNDVTQTQQAQITKEDTSTRKTNSMISTILVIVCSAIYLFAWFTK